METASLIAYLTLLLTPGLRACNDGLHTKRDGNTQDASVVEAADVGPQVTFADGTVEGRIVSGNQDIPVQEYLGIQYGEAPVGVRRYADPVPVTPWQGVRQATRYGSSCYQPLDTTFGEFKGSNMWNPPNELSEDCLYLNVWTPHPRPQKAVVMVWIFGGGYYSGTSALAVYDGKTLAGYSNVIVVSMNYRVGSLGFLATGDGRVKGNFGLKDQQLALAWVHTNIAQFGGDPDMVTIMGESAGAASVGYHMMSPGSQGLFRRSIMQSGSPDAHWASMSRGTAKERSGKLFEALGCVNDDAVLNCLRHPNITASTIINNDWVDGHFMVFPWAPVVDGVFVTDTPANMLKEGMVKDADLLIGVNKDEGTFWILYAVSTYSKDNSSVQTREEMLADVDITDYDLPESLKDTMVQLYTKGMNPSNTTDNRDVLDDMVGDRSFICPTLGFAKASYRRHQATFLYRLEQRSSNEVWPQWMGVIHGADVQYVFGIPLNQSLGYSADDAALSREIMTYWSTFARYGTPNGPGSSHGTPNGPGSSHGTPNGSGSSHGTPNGPGSSLSVWPQYDVHEVYIDFLPGATSQGSKLRATYCEFWDVVNAIKCDEE